MITPSPLNRRFCILLASGVLLLGTAACGSNASSTSQESGEELTPLTVGVFPAADLAPVFLAKNQGFFDEHGLDVETQMLDGGAAVAASIVAGDAQIGYSNIVSIITARGQGLPVTIVAPSVNGGANPEEAYDGVMVSPESDIQSTADLKGKTVAVNALGNILDVSLRASLEKAGVSPEDVQMIEIPLGEMPAAVESGQVDAAYMVEPFITLTLNNEAGRIVATPFEEIAPNLVTAAYFSVEKFTTENPDVVEKFRSAIQDSVAYAEEHPEALRATVGEYTEIDQETIDKMRWAQMATEITRDQIEFHVELLDRYGIVESGNVDVDALLAGLESN